MEELLDLVAAYRILAAHGVIDAYGHVSLRSPRNPQRYYVARSLAPELVTEADLVEYDLDSRPINGLEPLEFDPDPVGAGCQERREKGALPVGGERARSLRCRDRHQRAGQRETLRVDDAPGDRSGGSFLRPGKRCCQEHTHCCEQTFSVHVGLVPLKMQGRRRRRPSQAF